MILSVLIATVPERAHLFNKLYDELNRQLVYMRTVHPTLGNIEILVDGSKKFLDGGLSIGKKREALVQRATGVYLCFLDDDEGISPNYLETLVRLCNESPDVVTFKNISKMENYWTIIDMSLEFQNEQARPNDIVRRRPWHICPVKTHLAKMYEFSDSNYGEDFEWMDKVLSHCMVEAKTNAVLHEYNHGKHSLSDQITHG